MGNTTLHLVTVDAAPAYVRRHWEAIHNPRGIECAITAFRDGLLRYGLEYGEHFEGLNVGSDAILGDQGWLEMARAYLTLLNGPTGRLDCGTLDSEVRGWAERFGFSEEV